MERFFDADFHDAAKLGEAQREHEEQARLSIRQPPNGKVYHADPSTTVRLSNRHGDNLLFKDERQVCTRKSVLALPRAAVLHHRCLYLRHLLSPSTRRVYLL